MRVLLSLLRKFFIVLLSLVVFTTFSAIVLAWVYEEEIENIAVAKLNEQLQSHITVADIDFSILNHFPYAAISFSDIQIKESYPSSTKNLLDAAEISLLFNVIDIYHKKYRIKKLYIANGSLHARTNAAGESNYNIIKSGSTTSGKFLLDIETIQLANVQLKYVHASFKQEYLLMATTATLSGRFTDTKYNLTIDGSGVANSIRIKGTQYIQNKPITASLQLAIDDTKKTYRFTGGRLTLPQMPLSINGMIQLQKAGLYSDVEILGNELTIQSFLAQLPTQYAQQFANYSSTGNFSFFMQMKGLSSTQTAPAINVTATIANASITAGKYNQTLENVFLSATYTNGKAQSLATSVLTLSNIKADLDNKPLQANMSITNFENPYLILSLAADLDLAQLRRFLPESVISEASGSMAANIRLQGLFSELNSMANLNSATTAGTIILKDVHVKTKAYQLDFSGINASLSLQAGTLLVNSFSGKIANSTVQLSGEVPGILAYITNPKQAFVGNFKITTPYINLRDFLAITQGEKPKDSIEDFNISPLLDLTVSATIGSLDFDQFNGKNIKSDFTIKDQIIRAAYFSANAMDGEVQGKFSIDAAGKQFIYINADAIIKSVNIKSLFTQCKNFGQTVLIDKNLKGELTANLSFSSVWTKGLRLLQDKIYAKSTVLIENGELNDFEPLLALSKYVDVNELKNLKFATLQNQIVIEDRTIYIPLMNVENNALNLSLTGQHTFDNEVDYRIRILFSDLLRKRLKVRQRFEEFGPVEDDGAGKTTLFLKMTGKADNPKISLDRESVRAKMRDDLKQEGQEIKQLLKEEFKNIFKGGSAVISPQEGGADWENDIPKVKVEVKSQKVKTEDKLDTPNPVKEKTTKKSKALQDIENDFNKEEEDN